MRVSRFLRSVCQGLYVNVSLHCLIDDGVETREESYEHEGAREVSLCLFVCLESLSVNQGRGSGHNSIDGIRV